MLNDDRYLSICVSWVAIIFSVALLLFYLAAVVPVSSPPGSLQTLQGVSSSLQALRPQGPTITPSLANHYRDDLVNHVRGWPAELLEKQVNDLQN